MIRLNSIATRLVLGLVAILIVSQFLNTVLSAYSQRQNYERLMLAEAREQYAMQIVALLEDPNRPLPAPARRKIEGSDAVWRADFSIFEGQTEPSDPKARASVLAGLAERGITPLNIAVQFDVSTKFEGLEGPIRSPFRGPVPPIETLIAGQFDGIDDWIHARLRGGPPPPPVSIRDFLQDTVVVALMGLIGILFVTREINRSLTSLRQAAEEVGSSDDHPGFDTNGGAEFQPVFDAFNRMTERVNVLLREKDVMLGALGHDLRTPLTSLRIRLEGMEPEDKRTAAIDTVDMTAGLLEDILELARPDHSPSAKQKYDIGSLVMDVVQDAEDRGEDVSVEVKGRAVACCRPGSVRRMVQNLVNNAVAYAGSAHVTVITCDTEIQILIDDEGPGLPEEMLQKVTEPFQRGEDSRGRSMGGSGLGLTLARAVAEAHGGYLELSNRSHKGLRTKIVLPV